MMWWWLPASLFRRPVYLLLACLLGLGIAAPAALALLAPRDELVRTVARVGLGLLERDPTLHALIDDMEPARRDALPTRLEAEARRVLPALAALGLAAAVAAAATILLLGRFLESRLVERPERAIGRAVTAAPRSGRTGPCVAAMVGFAVHLPFLRTSLNIDEALAALVASSGWWAWADTTLGWSNHIGGMLLVRISTALFGVSEWSVRLPAALASAAGLGVTYAWVRGSHGRVAAVLATGLIAGLPLWAEQTALCRGYGLAFLAGAIGLQSLWRVADGRATGSEGRVIGALFLAHLAGFLAHFFFLFFSLASLLVLGLRARASDAVAAAAMVWVGLALVPGILLCAPGLPATLYQSGLTQDPGLGAARLGWFLHDFGFRLGGTFDGVAVTLLAAAVLVGAAMVPPVERLRIALVLAVAIGLPLLLRSVYFYPRYLMHLLPLLWLGAVPVAWVLERLLPRSVAAGTAIALGIGLWALPHPWSMGSVVDLRKTAQILTEAAARGRTVVAESTLRGMLFYGTGDRVRYHSLAAIPPDAEVIARSYAPGDLQPPPPGFREMARAPGSDVVVVIYEAISDSDRASGAP